MLARIERNGEEIELDVEYHVEPAQHGGMEPFWDAYVELDEVLCDGEPFILTNEETGLVIMQVEGQLAERPE